MLSGSNEYGFARVDGFNVRDSAGEVPAPPSGPAAGVENNRLRCQQCRGDDVKIFVPDLLDVVVPERSELASLSAERVHRHRIVVTGAREARDGESYSRDDFVRLPDKRDHASCQLGGNFRLISMFSKRSLLLMPAFRAHDAMRESPSKREVSLGSPKTEWALLWSA